MLQHFGSDKYPMRWGPPTAGSQDDEIATQQRTNTGPLSGFLDRCAGDPLD